MALINKLTAIADAIREKTGTTEPMTLDSMATAISGITGGGGGELSDYIPESALTISGDCSYMFCKGKWDWFIEKYGDRITTSDITTLDSVFFGSNITSIPFDINCRNTSINANQIFGCCFNLTNVPKINNLKPSDVDKIFQNCYRLRSIPNDWCDNWDWSEIEGSTSQYSGKVRGLFNSCYSLRNFPMDIISHGNPNITSSNSIYQSLFYSCYSLDEIINLPIPNLQSTWTNNVFGITFSGCSRLKNMTFATQENGTPYSVKWKNQVIDLSNCILFDISYITNYNSGITADKEVTDDATYQALKDDPDWFTCKKEYSRYNHDSAVRTINSLPDTSAYLASVGGTNTIKFDIAYGFSTDGGAINNLTEEEIAVATAKGWTLSFCGVMPMQGSGIGGEPSA